MLHCKNYLPIPRCVALPPALNVWLCSGLFAKSLTFDNCSWIVTCGYLRRFSSSFVVRNKSSMRTGLLRSCIGSTISRVILRR